ncbi:MAG: RNA methyltransferase [Elusimicrobia bacterium]|nr:RNA methyltransferase [Elusimicrobiota bacterium]
MISLRVVLVRTSNGLNIGAVARAMANFGLEDLVAVSPYAPRWREAKSATHGSGILKRARRLTLDEAVRDCRLVLGTASAHNRAQRRPTVTLPALRAWLARRLAGGGRVAVLFGSERNGLDNDELSRCQALLRIPTAAEAPSMNLGQAAALVAYELSRPVLERSVTSPGEAPAEGRHLEGLVDAAMRAMDKAGVNRHLAPGARRERFRRGLAGWRMTRADASWLRGLLERLSRK